jgi:hypothetical protein
MGRVKELLFESEDAERAAWEGSPEGREHSVKVRQEAALRTADAAARAARQERAWAAAWPREWGEWRRVRLLLDAPIAFGDSQFDFDEFLKEVGRAPSPRHVVRRKRAAEPYRPGNMGWVEDAPVASRSPYLSSSQAAEFLGIALQTLRNKRAVIQPVNGSRPLMYDPKTLEAYLRGRGPRAPKAARRGNTKKPDRAGR